MTDSKISRSVHPYDVPSMTTPGEEIANIEEAARCLSLISSNHKKLLRNALV